MIEGRLVSTEAQRSAELQKYERAYAAPNYRMGAARLKDAEVDLREIPCRGSYLDVACGRGEMLSLAQGMGFSPVHGTEIVPELLVEDLVVFGTMHALPFADDSVDVVTLFDVIEHLIPGDDELACRELLRLARKHIILTANNKPSKNKDGDNLHINIRTYEIWNELFRSWFAPSAVTWVKGTRHSVSATWRIDL